MHKPDGEVKVAVVGKYTQLEDAYKSISEALTHGGMFNRVKVKLEWIDAEIFEEAGNVTDTLSGFHAVLVPGGFGERGN
jgi:CTP synthase